jgi:hypothetical protein
MPSKIGTEMTSMQNVRAARGSQKWLQILINDYPSIIFKEIAHRIGIEKEEHLRWLSPLENDNYDEYKDEFFLEKLGVNINSKQLLDFWPKRGPVWDGLGKTANGDLLLVEAKSHLAELISHAKAKNSSSRDKIHDSLSKTKRFLRSESNFNWSNFFYQYANRLAHLYFLRELNKLPAFLVFIYFLKDNKMNGPNFKEEWEGALNLQKILMGIKNHRLSKFVLEVFIDINLLNDNNEVQLSNP